MAKGYILHIALLLVTVTRWRHWLRMQTDSNRASCGLTVAFWPIWACRQLQ